MSDFLIKRGDIGDDVTHIQCTLIILGYSVGTAGPDGKFGSKTEEAVKEFQRDHGLMVDGLVGPETTEKLADTYVEYVLAISKVLEALDE